MDISSLSAARSKAAGLGNLDNTANGLKAVCGHAFNYYHAQQCVFRSPFISPLGDARMRSIQSNDCFHHSRSQMIDSRTAPYAATVLRTALGVMFIAHALLKYFVCSPFRHRQFFQSLGLPGVLAM